MGEHKQIMLHCFILVLKCKFWPSIMFPLHNMVSGVITFSFSAVCNKFFLVCMCIYMCLCTLSVQQDVIHLILCLPFGINAGVCINVLMWEHGIFYVAKFSTLMP